MIDTAVDSSRPSVLRSSNYENCDGFIDGRLVTLEYVLLQFLVLATIQGIKSSERVLNAHMETHHTHEPAISFSMLHISRLDSASSFER